MGKSTHPKDTVPMVASTMEDISPGSTEPTDLLPMEMLTQQDIKDIKYNV